MSSIYCNNVDRLFPDNTQLLSYTNDRAAVDSLAVYSLSHDETVKQTAKRTAQFRLIVYFSHAEQQTQQQQLQQL